MSGPSMPTNIWKLPINHCVSGKHILVYLSPHMYCSTFNNEEDLEDILDHLDWSQGD